MINSLSATVLHCRLLLVAGLFIVDLFSGCILSRQEVPESNYNPYVLKPGVLVEVNWKIVNMDGVAPPDTKQ